MASQKALWLYSIIHSGKLGVDGNKGHEIVMKQCDGGDDDDRKAAGKNSSPLTHKAGRSSLCFGPKNVFPLLFTPSAWRKSANQLYFRSPSPLLFFSLSCSHPQHYPPHTNRFLISICQYFCFHFKSSLSPHSLPNSSSPPCSSLSLETCCPLVRD